MITLDPNEFERHFKYCVDRVNLTQQFNEIIRKSNAVQTKLLLGLKDSLENGVVSALPIFLTIMDQIDKAETDFLGVKDYTYYQFGGSLSVTLDLLLALYSINQELGQASSFILKTKDALGISDDVERTIFLSTPCSFGYDEEFYVVAT